MHPQKNTMANGLSANELIQCPMAVSANGNFYSVSSLDGQLHIWDTLSADLIADYTPSAHLSATCVRLSWPPLSSNTNVLSSPTKRRKKLKTGDKDVQQEIEKFQLIALGTANGTILLYSVTKNELFSQLANGHSDRVNDIAWHPESDSLFSCSNDKYVVEWSISKSSIKSKHMLDRSVVNAISVIDNKNILTASNNIKWWNWETRQLLKTFNGHATEVRYLKPIIFGPIHQYNNILLSTSISDRYISAWELNESKNSNSIANFALDDDPISLEIAYTTSNNFVYILSISRSGFLYIFEHLFSNDNGSRSGNKTNGITLTSPIVPKIKLQINATLVKNARPRSRKSTADSMRQLPFLCAHLNSEVLPVDSETNSSTNNFFLMIGYGNVNRPVFERISYSECEKCHLKNGGVLERTEINSANMPSIVDESNNTKIKSKQSAKDTEKTTVIGPAGIVSSQPLYNNINNKNGNNQNGDINSDDEEAGDEINNNYIEVKSSPKKSSQNKSDKTTENQKVKTKQSKEEITLGEQLAQISEEEKANKRETKRKKRKHKLSESAEQANTDSLVNVLMQGLKSKDTKMLQTVLNSPEETVIRNTIKKLPVSYIPNLITELQRGLFKNGDHQQIYLKWISLVMQVKISHLMTANVSNEFLSLNQLLSARTAILDRCYQLKGRLDIMLSQIKSDKRTQNLTRTKPQLTYESDSSESDIEMNDEDEEDEEEDEDILSMDDHDLMNTDDESDDDEELHDEEMYQSAPEDEDDDDETSDRGRSKVNSTDMDADNDSDEDDDDDD